MSSSNTAHFLFIPALFWGHISPFCIIATRLVLEQENVAVTFIVAPDVLDKTRTEISRQFLNKPKALQRIRILSPCLPNDVGIIDKMNTFADAYAAAYQTLYQAKPITCSATGTMFDAVSAPCAVIIDVLSLPQLHATRAISGYSVPIILCVIGGVGTVLRRYGPESMGGVGDLGAIVDAETARTGLSDAEIGLKIYSHTEGKLVQVPGVPAMYDYEFFPQKLPSSGLPFHKFIREAYLLFRECEATIVISSYAYESKSLDAMKEWFSDMKKEVHVLGPLLPSRYGIEIQNSEERVSVEIEAFLEEMQLQHGKRSVFFISFGTLFYPTISEYVDELIEALIEKRTPFIFALAASSAKISEPLIEKVESSGLGKITAWSPQQFILNHPATGWFLSHGGINSVTESLGSGVPLICWPFSVDQPVTTAHLTENLNVAFELYQVRTGDGLKPLARNGIAAEGTREAVGIEIRQTIDLCRSEKGQVLRRNAEEFKLKFAKAWEDDGIAKQEIRKFLHKYTSALL